MAFTIQSTFIVITNMYTADSMIGKFIWMSSLLQFITTAELDLILSNFYKVHFL